MRIKRPPEDDVGISMTPLIDMVFLLLIFFLVATKFADIERDVRIRPPSARSARPVTEMPREIVINVTREGRFLIAGQEMNMDALDGMLATAVARNPQQVVVIRGDRETVLQYAVNVLDLCEKHHVDRAFLTTRTTGQ